jgi:myo-inositol-1(or 4)-monophosphatase
MDDLERRVAFAQVLADAAGAVIGPYFRSPVPITDKGRPGFFDPVTEADRRAEDAMRKTIAAEFPEDGIIGEEFGAAPGSSGFDWVLDPIDGTRSFVAGNPLWGTLIGLEHHGRAVLGLLDQPFLHERFTGCKTTELRDVNGTTILHARECAALADALVCTTHPITYFDEEQRAKFQRLEQACRFSRYGGDCYSYALLAMGYVDLVVEAQLKHWDVAALNPIVRGAGGIFTDWNGDPAPRGGNVIAADDPRIHAAAVELLAR